MALVFAQAGTPMQKEPNGQATTLPHPGNSAVIALGAASVNVALPVDGASKPYQAVRLAASQPAWVAFAGTGSDAVVAATAPAFLVNPGSTLDIAIPEITAGVNCGFIAAIQAGTGGSLSILGLY